MKNQLNFREKSASTCNELQEFPYIRLSKISANGQASDGAPSVSSIRQQSQPSCTGTKDLSPQLLIVRGLPGSGKSTIAKAFVLIGFVHYEADMYFVSNGQYKYDPAKIRNAHDWCKAKTAQALQSGQKVVVSNTFTRLSEMDPYLSMTDDVDVIEAFGKWGNRHGVPQSRLDEMALRWESFDNSKKTITK